MFAILSIIAVSLFSLNAYSMQAIEPDLQCFNVRAETPEEAAKRLASSEANQRDMKENLEPYRKLYESIGKRALLELIQCDEAEKIVEFLTVYPHWTTSATPNGKSLFHLLARYNSFETIRRLAAIGLEHQRKQTQPPFDLQWLIVSLPVDNQSNTHLMDAVENDSYEAAQELLKIITPAANFKNKANRTTLDMAKTPRMRLLLQYSSAFSRAEFPSQAATRLRVNENDALLEPYIRLRESIGNKTLLELIEADDYYNIVKFLTVYPYLTTFVFPDGKTLFHVLALYNSYKTIRHLAALGKSPNKPPFNLELLLVNVPIDGQSNTPLMDAAEQDSYEAAQELITLQGNSELQNKSGQTAFALAKNKKMQRLLRLDHPFTLRTNTPSEIVKARSLKLLLQGAPESEKPWKRWYPNPQKYCKVVRDNVDTETPSHDKKDKREHTDEKAKQEHEVHIPDSDLHQAIGQAAYADLSNAFQKDASELVSNDRATVMQDHETLRPYAELFESIGSTPLLNLIKADDYRNVLGWLAVHPTYAQIKTNDGKTIFHLLARHNSYKTIRAFGARWSLLDESRNALDNELHTPLMDAVENNSYEAARELVKFKAATKLKNKDGYTAFDMARTPQMQQLLRLPMTHRTVDEDDKREFEHPNAARPSLSSASGMPTMRRMSNSSQSLGSSAKLVQNLTATSSLAKAQSSKSSRRLAKAEPKGWSENYPYLLPTLATCSLAAIGYGIYNYFSVTAKAQ